MNNMAPKDVVQGIVVDAESEYQIRAHMALLGHDGLGVTELRAVVDGRHWVAYADSVAAVLELCRQMEGRASAVYVGVQPRPAHRYDQAPNRWVPARGGAGGNSAYDREIAWVSAVFFDIDVVSPLRQQGHPASDEELKETLRAAQWLARQDGLALSSAICCSGNGHYVLAPLIPIAVGSAEMARKFVNFCRQLADSAAGRFPGVRIDAVYNLSRIMRVMGTVNRKGEPLPDRPHRRACLVTEPPLGRSLALHHMILNAEVQEVVQTVTPLPVGLKCNLAKIEECEFIQWCRRYPLDLSEPAWFALISNLAHLEGGIELIHAISALDGGRYDYADTQRVIERILREGYKPNSCRTIMTPAMATSGRGVFRCSRIESCPARAPMYMAADPITHLRQEDTSMQQTTNNKPIKVFRYGCVKTAIWLNHTVIDRAVVPIHSIQLTKIYQQDGEWKSTTSLSPEDLPKAALVLTEAYRFLRLQSEEPNESTKRQEVPNGNGSLCDNQDRPSIYENQQPE